MKQFLSSSLVIFLLVSCTDNRQQTVKGQPSSLKTTAADSALYVQWLNQDSISGMDAFRRMERMSTQIDSILRRKSLGSLGYSRFGEAGANMIFSTSNFHEAFSEVKTYLNREKLMPQVLLVLQTKGTDNWKYSILEPIGYKGVFNPE